MTKSQYVEVGTRVLEILDENDYRRSSHSDEWVSMTSPYSIFDNIITWISPYIAVKYLKESSFTFDKCPSYLQPYWQ